jgi:hypothetical protein
MKSLIKPSPFDRFCEKYLDGIYNSNLSLDEQSNGYKQLRKMVLLKISPSSESEYKKWKMFPTLKELFSEPDIRHLTFLHENVRELVRKNWNYIKKLRVD